MCLAQPIAVAIERIAFVLTVGETGLSMNVLFFSSASPRPGFCGTVKPNLGFHRGKNLDSYEVSLMHNNNAG